MKGTNDMTHTVKVGDIFRSTWGFNETRHEFLKVTKILNKNRIAIERLSKLRTKEDFNKVYAGELNDENEREYDKTKEGSYKKNTIVRVDDKGNLYIKPSRTNKFEVAKIWDGKPVIEATIPYYEFLDGLYF